MVDNTTYQIQTASDSYKEHKYFGQKTIVEANTLIIKFNLHKRSNDKELPSNLEEIIPKGLCLYYRRIDLERNLSIKELTFQEELQLLKEVCIINKDNLMLNYTGASGDD